MRLFVLILASVTLSVACRHASPALPSYGDVPSFKLTDQTGQPFNSKILEGKIWVADFMYTNCPGPCPRMASRMHQVQEATSKEPGVEFVSFTVDPVNDTPAVLTQYAKEHGASPTRWHFLTGPVPTLHQLCRYAFKLGNVDGSLEHSTKFVLVDGRFQIRGYYDSFDPDSIKQLETDIHALTSERT